MTTDEAHAEKIRQVEEEIAALQPFADGRTAEALQQMPAWANDTVPALLAQGIALCRILAREQEVLADLKRGWKGTPA